MEHITNVAAMFEMLQYVVRRAAKLPSIQILFCLDGHQLRVSLPPSAEFSLNNGFKSLLSASSSVGGLHMLQSSALEQP